MTKKQHGVFWKTNHRPQGWGILFSEMFCEILWFVSLPPNTLRKISEVITLYRLVDETANKWGAPECYYR
jgi:hypothetical protein